MEIIIQLLSLGTVFGLTFLFFNLVKRNGRGLLFNKKEGQIWQQTIKGRFGIYITATNILGTLTSLATAYLFFMGASGIFGWWILACCISLLTGGFVSNAITKKIIRLPRPKKVISNESQNGAVVASLFWSDNKRAKSVARLVKLISLASIAGVVWLEFFVFGDISGYLLGFDVGSRAILVGAIAASVFAFTFHYGLRGFVLADLLHSPLIGFCVLFLLLGTGWLLFSSIGPSSSPVHHFGQPVVDLQTGILFVLNVFAANSFWVLISETHWFRMWLFEEKEIRVQIPSLLVTSFIWLLLILTGFAATELTGKHESEAIKELLAQLADHSYAFLAAFWIGGAAALFSTADVQTYCFRLVQSFDVRSGKIPDNTKAIARPFLMTILLSIFAGLIYLMIRLLEIPDAKLIFCIVPLSLNLIPAFLQLAFHRQVTTTPLYISLCLYIAFSGAGLLQPAESLSYNLVASISPAIVGILAIFFGKREEQDAPA